MIDLPGRPLPGINTGRPTGTPRRCIWNMTGPRYLGRPCHCLTDTAVVGSLNAAAAPCGRPGFGALVLFSFRRVVDGLHFFAKFPDLLSHQQIRGGVDN